MSEEDFPGLQAPRPWPKARALAYTERIETLRRWEDLHRHRQHLSAPLVPPGDELVIGSRRRFTRLVLTVLFAALFAGLCFGFVLGRMWEGKL